MAHIQELKRRCFFIALSVGGCTGLAWAVQAQLTALLLKPAGGQQFIYTSPGGGVDFQLRLCLTAGIVCSLPVIVFHIFRYAQPLLGPNMGRFLRRATLFSALLAAAGVLFGYVLGLPPSLHFLLQTFSSERIQALITIQSYMSFVTMYLLGSAIIFQLPLILLLINRIKPLKPQTLMRQQRWLIAGAVVAGAIISPTPDVRNLLMISGPIILMYECSVMLIWLINRGNSWPKQVRTLHQQDVATQARRLAQFEEARRSLKKQLLNRRQALDTRQKAGVDLGL